MKATLARKNRHATRRTAALTHIGQIGPFLEGHLSAFKRPGCAQPGWHLTFKQQGKTRTVYVPMDLVPEVKLWTRNYQRLKNTHSGSNPALAGTHSRSCRQPAGCKPQPCIDEAQSAAGLTQVAQCVFPELNQWFNAATLLIVAVDASPR